MHKMASMLKQLMIELPKRIIRVLKREQMSTETACLVVWMPV